MSYPGGYGGPDSGAEDEEISLNQNIIRGSGSQSRERACDGCRRSSSRFYESNKLCVWITGGVVFLISIILFACSFDVVKPTQFGLFQNGWSGSVDTSYVYDAGRYFVWLRNFFITVPAYRVNIEFSAAKTADAPPVPGRTGRDLSDPDSGGQPVTLSFSFQYQFKREDVGKVYNEFGNQYEPRFLLFARMAVSDVAQKYTPDKFWTHRSEVAQDMFETIKKSLRVNGHCDVTNFQLLQVDFPAKYETMITDIQLQVQYKLTSEYQQKVTDVLKDIDIMTATNKATIASINAGASATSALLVNKAKTDGFYIQQSAKAESYAELANLLQLTKKEVLDYVKIHSLTGGLDSGRTAQTVVGTAQPSMVMG